MHQILHFNSAMLNIIICIISLTKVLFQGYGDCKTRNHITSSDSQVLSDDERIGVSVNDVHTTSQSVEVKEPTKINDYAIVAKGKYLLICDSCLWCASYFDSELMYAKCPGCNKGKIECMPISDTEKKSYSFNHSDNRGVELIYSNNIRS